MVEELNAGLGFKTISQVLNVSESNLLKSTAQLQT